MSVKIKLFGFILLSLLANAWANEVIVSNSDGTTATFTTIQAAIDACPQGGTVFVSPGTYTEAIRINKGIALIGIGTPTIIETSCIDKVKNLINYCIADF